MSVNLPFYNVDSDDFLGLFNNAQSLDYDSLKNINFDPSLAWDKYDASEINSNLPQHTLSCNYYHLNDLVMSDTNINVPFSLLSYNIRSVENLLESFYQDIPFMKFSFIGLCESRLDEAIVSMYKVPTWNGQAL